MGRAKPSVLSRRLVVTSVLLSIFVLFDLFLFGWLILRSLTQREIDRVAGTAQWVLRDGQPVRERPEP